MVDEIAFGEFAEWLLLPLQATPEVLVEHVLDRFADDPAPDVTKQAIAEHLPVLADEVSQGASTDDTQVFAVWVLLPSGGKQLTIIGCAFAALMRNEPGTGPADFVERLTDGLQLYQPVDVSEIETTIGTAHLVRVRTYDQQDHGMTLSEMTSVFWLPKGESFAIWLNTLPSDDLVAAADIASALEQFAASISASA